MDELISIIVPVYNSEKYLEKCIISLMNQTYSNIEIILINDGSTDDSIHLMNTYSKKDSRIRIINQSNTGVSGARNKGLLVSKGNRLLFVDSDDYIDSEYIQKLSSSKSDFIMCSYKTISSNKIINGETLEQIVYNNNILNELLKPEYKKIIVVPYAKIFKKNIILDNNIKFDESMSYGEDTSFVFKYLCHCKNAIVMNYDGYNNVVLNESSLSRKHIKNIYIQLKKLNEQIHNIKDMSECLKYYWYFRNFKAILYNEKNSNYSHLKNVFITIHNDTFFKIINNKTYFGTFDKFLYFLIKYKFYFILYIMYKIR